MQDAHHDGATLAHMRVVVESCGIQVSTSKCGMSRCDCLDQDR